MNPAADRNRVLFVCTANICRSPAAEALARHHHGESLWLFRSAGFLFDGEPSPPNLIEALGEMSIDGSRHRSNLLNEQSLEAADIVLTMEGEHVQRATLLHRPAFPKIVPLREAAEVMKQMPSADFVSIADLLDLINTERDPGSYLSNRWDIEDPYKRKIKEFRRAISEISALVDGVFSRLR